MNADDIQNLCQRGQDQLSRMEYLAAEKTLAEAEGLAWGARDWDSLSRLYMPLQESRRQRRQRCGEGTIRLDFVASRPDDALNGPQIVRDIGQGQILIAGWETVEPAIAARRAAAELGLYVDVFLAAVYPGADCAKIVIFPAAESSLKGIETTAEELDAVRSYEAVMDVWERLHAPFLAEADGTADPLARIGEYRRTIQVDYACELAHQKLADTARRLSVKVNG